MWNMWYWILVNYIANYLWVMVQCLCMSWESVEWEIGLIFRLLSCLMTWPKCKYNSGWKTNLLALARRKGAWKTSFISQSVTSCRKYMYIIRITCRIAGAVPFGRAIYLYCLCPVEDLKMQFLRSPTHRQFALEAAVLTLSLGLKRTYCSGPAAFALWEQ